MLEATLPLMEWKKKKKKNLPLLLIVNLLELSQY